MPRVVGRRLEEPEPYRGANANMHRSRRSSPRATRRATRVWAARALRIAGRLIDEFAAARVARRRALGAG